MDPITAIGVAGSAVGIAGFGIQLCQVLGQYLSQVWSAQENLEAIVHEIDSTTSALEELYQLLSQEVDNLRLGGPLRYFSAASLIKVKATADRCLVVFWRVEATISGTELEGELVKKLDDFNEKLAFHTPETPIRIETELTSDHLGLLDKIKWASKASKLDKYCKQLQRHQASLTLLLHIVSIAQQRLKPNLTEEGAKLMLKSYAIINQIATPEELQIIAYEAQAYGPRKSIASRPRVKHVQTPSRGRGMDRQQNNISQSSNNTGNNGVYSPRNTSKSPPAKSLSKDVLTNGSTPTPHNRIHDQPPVHIVTSPGRRQLVHFSSSVQGGEQTDTSVQSQSGSEAVIPGVPDEESDSAMNGQGNNSKEAGAIGQQSPSPSVPTMCANSCSHGQTQSAGDKHVDRVRKDDDSAKRVSTDLGLLPYIIDDHGAYQLPVILEVELKRKIQGRPAFRHPSQELAEKLAFLSERQIGVLQALLRYQEDPEKQVPKLAHLEVMRKPSAKFWQKPSRVMIAFIEGDTPSLPARVDVTEEARYENDEKSDSSTLGVPMVQRNRRQDIISSIPPVASAFVPQDGQKNLDRNVRSLPKLQDVTPLLASENEWRKRFAEYRVWTIRPISTVIDLPDSWDRCIISEEPFGAAEIGRRLSLLDKKKMTAIEKMATLAASQQIQITQSIEAAKANEIDPQFDWQLRQLEIVRMRKVFKPKYVKAIIVYVIKIPPSSAFGPSRGPSRGPSQDKRGASRTMMRGTNDEDENISLGPDDSISRYGGDRIKTNSGPARARSREEIQKRIEEQNSTIASRPSVVSTSGQRSRSPVHRSTSISARDVSPPYATQAPTRVIIRDRSTSPSRGRSREYSPPPPPQDQNTPDDYLYYDDNDVVYEREVEYLSEPPCEGEYYTRERARSPEDQQIVLRNLHRNNETAGNEEQYHEVQVRSRQDYDEIPEEVIYHERSSDRPHYRLSRYSRVSEYEEPIPREFPRRLKYYDAEEMREMKRGSYPTEFDAVPYDPQDSPQATAARQKAVEQLLLEWTPLHEPESGDNDEDGNEDNPILESHDEPVTDSRQMRATVQDATTENGDAEHESGEGNGEEDVKNFPDPISRESSAVSEGNQSHWTGPTIIQDTETVEREQLERETISASPEPHVVTEEKGHATATTPSKPTLSLETRQYSQTTADDLFVAKEPKRRETTDGNGIMTPGGTKNGMHPTARRQETTEDILQTLRKGDHIPRVSTLPTPAPQAWADVDWARQIVEETATIAETETSPSPPPPLSRRQTEEPVRAETTTRREEASRERLSERERDTMEIREQERERPRVVIRESGREREEAEADDEKRIRDRLRELERENAVLRADRRDLTDQLRTSRHYYRHPIERLSGTTIAFSPPNRPPTLVSTPPPVPVPSPASRITAATTTSPRPSTPMRSALADPARRDRIRQINGTNGDRRHETESDLGPPRRRRTVEFEGLTAPDGARRGASGGRGGGEKRASSLHPFS
ncbi:hypothetical protein F5Y16DRAFT_374377, partial [Xylariaceae sp. FL0255]